MDFSRAFVIVGIALVLVILFNVAIYFGYGRKNSRNEFNDMIKAMKKMRNPWEEEDKDLHELSKRVATLKKDLDDDQPDTKKTGSPEQR